jgi:hypothetical protein
VKKKHLLCYYAIVEVFMKRTTIMLPEDLKKMVEDEAYRRGSSAGEVIRLALKESFPIIVNRAVQRNPASG